MHQWLPDTPAIGPQEFEWVIANHPVVVVHFWASWNGHDREMDVRLQALRPQFAGEIAFRSFATDPPEAWEVCRRYCGLNLPSLVCFLGGQYHETLIGLGVEAATEERLRAWAAAGAAFVVSDE